MASEHPVASLQADKHRAMLEKVLPTLRLNNKMVWVYLLGRLQGYIDRSEVDSLTAMLSDDYQKHKGCRTLSELCQQATIRRAPKDILLEHFCLQYDPPRQEPQIIPSENQDNGGRRFSRAVDVLSGGSQLLKDLYALEGFGEVNVERPLIGKATSDPDCRSHERFVLTNQGSQHAWLLDRLFQDAIYPHISQDGLLIVTDRYGSKVDKRQVSASQDI